MAVKEYRYIEGGDKELQFNVHVKEMIAMYKYEEVKQNLYARGIKLSKHALERFKEHFNISNIATATKLVKDNLNKAIRIGSVIAFDGRINVLYAYKQIAYYLSPDLKTVVTINNYKEITFQPILKAIEDSREKANKELLLSLHLEHLRKIEEEEERQVKIVLEIEKKVEEANSMYVSLLNVSKGRKKQIKELISIQNHSLKIEGWKLFSIMRRKRHICKSLVSLC